MQTAIVPTAEARAVAFGPFTFDRTSRLLSRNGSELPLPPRVLSVLDLLLERPGELVTKQALISAVWRDAFVSETSLAEAISVLRQTLGDDPQKPTYIQTLHRRGYRFIAEVHDSGMVAVPTDRRAATETVAIEPEPRLSLLVPWLVTLFALLTAGVAVWRYVDTAAPLPAQPVRFTIALPAGLSLSTTGAPAAVSGDGSLIAFSACGLECSIYIRPLSRTEPTLVAGTSGGASPFFSSDGRTLGYFANGGLHTLALAGGSPVKLASAQEPLGATWLQDGRIVFARSSNEGLFVVPSAGGDVQSLTTTAQGQGGHRWPAALPDMSGVVFTVGALDGRSSRDYAGLVSLRTRTWGRLLDDVTAAHVPVPGYLMAQRASDIVASTFDDRTHSIAGLPAAVLGAASAQAAPQFAMSAAGTLIVAAPGGAAMQVILDWDSELRRLVSPPQPALPR